MTKIILLTGDDMAAKTKWGEARLMEDQQASIDAKDVETYKRRGITTGLHWFEHAIEHEDILLLMELPENVEIEVHNFNKETSHDSAE